MDKYNLIELNDLIGFGYEFNDNQLEKMGFILFGKHHLVTMMQVSYQGPKDRLVL